MAVRPSRLRFLVLVCACLLAATVAVDAQLSQGAVEVVGAGSYDGEFVNGTTVQVQHGALFMQEPAPGSENWTYYAQVVHAEPGERVRLHDPFLRAPLDLYVFGIDEAPMQPIPWPSGFHFTDPETNLRIETFTWGFLGPTDVTTWDPILYRPSIIRLEDIDGHTRWTEVAEPGDGWISLESRGEPFDGGLVFLWVNQTSLVGEHTSFFDSLQGSDRQRYETYLEDKSLVPAHRFVTAAQVLLGLGVAAGALALRRARRPAEESGGQAELVLLLRKAASYLRGLGAALLAGGLLLGLAGILLVGQVDDWRSAIALAHGRIVGLIAIGVFAVGYITVAIVWGQQVLAVVHEERRVSALAKQAETF